MQMNPVCSTQASAKHNFLDQNTIQSNGYNSMPLIKLNFNEIFMAEHYHIKGKYYNCRCIVDRC